MKNEWEIKMKIGVDQEYNGIKIETFSMGSFGCNCSLIYSLKTKEALVIDPGNDYDAFMKVIKDRDLILKKILHTHAHFDHIGQSGSISLATQAPLYLHKGDMFLYQALKEQGMFFGHEVGEIIPLDNFLEDEQTFGLEDPGLKDFLKTLHTPGHTPGSCCFYTEYFSEPVLFSGDTLFNQSIGRTDLPGGNTEEILKSIKERLLTLPLETQIVTGHGFSTVLHQEKSSNPFIQ
jgi:hydroxyacylglutathione hydrolase